MDVLRLTFFKLRFDSSLIFRAPFNSCTQLEGLNSVKIWSPFVFYVLHFSRKAHEK